MNDLPTHYLVMTDLISFTKGKSEHQCKVYVDAVLESAIIDLLETCGLNSRKYTCGYKGSVLKLAVKKLSRSKKRMTGSFHVTFSTHANNTSEYFFDKELHCLIDEQGQASGYQFRNVAFSSIATNNSYLNRDSLVELIINILNLKEAYLSSQVA